MEIVYEPFFSLISKRNKKLTKIHRCVTILQRKLRNIFLGMIYRRHSDADNDVKEKIEAVNLYAISIFIQYHISINQDTKFSWYAIISFQIANAQLRNWMNTNAQCMFHIQSFSKLHFGTYKLLIDIFKQRKAIKKMNHT